MAPGELVKQVFFVCLKLALLKKIAKKLMLLPRFCGKLPKVWNDPEQLTNCKNFARVNSLGQRAKHAEALTQAKSTQP